MSKTAKTVVGAIVAVIIIGGIWIGAKNAKKPQSPNEAEKETIKIGAILPLTGPASEYGIATQKGLDLAIKEINSRDGINGHKIQLVYEDDKCEPQVGITALNKLTLVDNVNIIIGSVCSSVTLALAPSIQEKNLLLISSGASNPRISSYSNIFRTWPSDALQGKYLAKVVKEKINLNKVAIIYINNDYGVGLKDAFKEEFLKQDGNIIAEEAISEGAMDVKAQLTKIKNLSPDGVFLASFAKEMGVILKQSNELSFISQFLGGEGTKDESVLEIGGQGAEGLIGTIPAFSDSNIRSSFLNSFKNEYGVEPGITADSAYDIPSALKYSIEKCQENQDINCIKNELSSVQFEGASGLISFDENGDLKNKTYDLITIKNGQFIPYEE